MSRTRLLAALAVALTTGTLAAGTLGIGAPALAADRSPIGGPIGGPVGRAGGGTLADQVAQYKRTHDTDPHLPLSAAQQRGMAARTAAARRALAITPATTSRTLAGTQQAEQTSYWCGPAAVSGALAVRGVIVSQSSSASMLRTTADGTDWSGTDANVPSQYRTGYPVADVLSYQLHGQGATYYPVGLSDEPTASEQATYRTRLVEDVTNGWDLVGDAWEVPGGPHLVGHPGNQEIFHYFTIRGYTSSGSYTEYQDPVHGASSISWSSGVPAYSTMASSTIATIVGGRGYIW